MRLALLVALDVIPEEVRAACLALNRLRNDFAHGKVEVLSRERADEIWTAFLPIYELGGYPELHHEISEITVGRTVDGEELPTIESLRNSLIHGYLLLDEMAKASREHRESTERLVELVASSRFLGLTHRIVGSLREAREEPSSGG